ncbi:LacI family DNA-binding transcriptional regulator [Streptomyces sp. 6N223]|uniref:LacI family DNA-binding transcriptional regulator n=1 Tax=Streptomyces sp. 6N223 TaxID=3457412 RepID=UPI003FD5E04B
MRVTVVTIKDVAHRAGVTKQTVSNVINKRPVVSPDTRKRVERAIADLGYTPNLLARGLATGQTMMVGLVVPNITNPFYAELVEDLERSLETEGYSIALCTTYGDPVRARRQLEILRRRYIDGLILADDGSIGRHVDLLTEVGLPFVLCASETEYPSGATVVTFDHGRAGYLAAQHLRDLGHREVAVVGDIPAHEVRLEGAHRALAEASITVAPSRIRATRVSSRLGGFEAAMSVLTEHPEVTAVMASHDLLALGVLQAAAELGRTVPGSLSIVSVDDIAAASQANPPLTTVAFAKQRMARKSAGFLVRALKSGQHRPGVTSLSPELVVRESTAPPSRN